jgi:signal peptide peptidase SppA
MKRHLRRRLKACLSQMLQSEHGWALHEPALGALVGALTLGPDLSRNALAAVLGMSSSEPPTTQMVGNVAVLPVFGVISQKSNWLTRALGWTSTDTLQRDFSEAKGNSQVKAIILYIDSPGGTTLGLAETSKLIFDARDAKPIYAFAAGLEASAAYWIGSAAKESFASPSSIVGSIGAVSTHIEFVKALADEGVAVTVVRSAPNKQLWNPYEKLDGEAKATLQKFVSDVGNQFELDVARNRGITQATVKSKFGQGNIYVSAEAASRGLIDGVLTWEQLLAKATQQVSASGDSAAASAVSLTQPTAAISAGIPAASAAEVPTAMKISARVRAALFARGLISAQDADESVCLVALSAFFTARGEACPQKDDKLDDDKVVAGLFALTPVAAAAAPTTPPANPAPPAAAASNVQQAHDREMAEARATGGQQERQRQADIRASAKLLNMPEAAITEAIDGGQSHAEIVAAWHVELSKRDKPVSPPSGGPTVTGEGADRFCADAVLAMQYRISSTSRDTRLAARNNPAFTDGVKNLSRAPLSYFAKQCLAARGTRVDEFLSAEEVMELAFAMDGEARISVGAAYSAYNRPGSFPNLLSNLANKMLDDALELNEPTYEEWTGVWPGDLPDFKPAPIVNKGQHDEMDEVLDGEASKEFGLDEEILGAMLLRRFSNAFKLTPVMAANDDLGAFQENTLGLETAWQNTVNRGCVRMLTANGPLLDGNNLFDSSTHGNDRTSGGAPSDSEWDQMQLLLNAQTGIGGKGFVRTSLGVALVPPKLWRAATQAFARFQVVGESKLATSDTNLNVYRGLIDVVKEPELHSFSDVVWYGFAKPRGMYNATIIRAYFRGWGRNGRRQRWYDPETKCWNFELEGRVGIAPKQYRLAARNAGQ